MPEEKAPKTCPFWKGPCRPDCMMYMKSQEKVVDQCAFAIIAHQLDVFVSATGGSQR